MRSVFLVCLGPLFCVVGFFTSMSTDDALSQILAWCRSISIDGGIDPACCRCDVIAKSQASPGARVNDAAGP